MHKGCIQIIKRALVFVLMCMAMPQIGIAQKIFNGAGQNLLDVQQRFNRGEISLEEAVSSQLQMLTRTDTEAIQKCAAPALMFFEHYSGKMDPASRTKIQNYKSERLTSAASLAEERYISPSGKFEIVYQTSGEDSVSLEDLDNNGTPDYVDLVAFAADSSYRDEVLNMGFMDPIPNGTTYKVYIVNLNFYGYADVSSDLGSDGPLTEIFIDNDFPSSVFPPNSHPDGLVTGAVYATIAHEFKHAIQYAQNEWQGPSGGIRWSEMDATLMEEVVFDDVNDYYNYIKTSFNSSDPYASSIFFAPQNGTPGSYYHVSWMIYFTEYYGIDIFRQVWESVEADNFLSIDDALRELLPQISQGESFGEAFTRNHLWHFASGNRSGFDTYGFKEKTFYPYANLEESFSSVPLEVQQVSSLRQLSARYFEIEPGLGDEGFIDVAVDFDSTQVGVGLLFYMNDGSMVEQIGYGEGKAQLYLPTEVSWEDITKLGIVITNPANDIRTNNVELNVGKSGKGIVIRDSDYADLPNQVKIFQNYPNPFNPITHINFELPRTSSVTLDIFDITGQKVRSLADRVYRLGSYSIEFNANGLSSGIYIYRLRIDNAVFTKKMTLIK